MILRVEGEARSVCWSPDGKRMAVGDSLGGLTVFTVDGQIIWRRQEHTGRIRVVRWSPDGTRISIGSVDNTVRLWDAQTGQTVVRIEAGIPLTVAWSPDSDRLAVCGWPNMICDTASGHRVAEIHGPSAVFGVDWSPDGKRVALGTGNDGKSTVKIWNLSTCQSEMEFAEPAGDVNSVKWSPDGSRLASGSDDKSVRVWDVTTGNGLWAHERHTSGVQSVDWSSDGKVVASGSADHTVRIWRAESGEEVRLFQHDNEVYSVAFSPGGDLLASASSDGTVRLWDVSDLVSARPVMHGNYVVRQAATVGRRVAVVSRPMWVPHLPSAEGKLLGVLQGRSVGIFSNGQSLAVGHPDGTVRMVDLRTGAAVWETKEHENTVNDVVVSPEGARLASGSEDSTVRIWNVKSGKCHLICHSAVTVYSVSWSPAGDRVAAGSLGDPLIVWSSRTGQELWRDASGGCAGVDWSHDGRFLASTSSFEGQIRIHSADTGEVLREWTNLGTNRYTIRWSPDDRYLASATPNLAIVIDSATGEVLSRSTEDQGNNIFAVAWSPDGRLIASGGGENKVRIWDAHAGETLDSFATSGEISRLVWSPDGGFLVVGSYGDEVRLWDTRDLMSQSSVTIPTISTHHPLASALAQLHRLSLHPPLSLVSDLLELTAGHDALPALASEPGIRSLAALRWPAGARVGLVALLLKGIPFDDSWIPPDDLPPRPLRDTLAAALHSGQSCPPEAPPAPTGPLLEAARRVDDRLLTLLALLGPQAVAEDPGLPLRLLPRIDQMQPLDAAHRRLLAQHVALGSPGQSSGGGGGGERAGIDRHGDIRSLLPSQFVYPPAILAFRHSRGELLYRARLGAEPPRLRPTILLLDVSPPSFGPVEEITRVAAHTLATALLRAGLPAMLVTSGGQETIHVLERTADLVEIWTQRTLERAHVMRSLKLARGLRERLRGEGGMEPIVVLLAHAWYGAEDDPIEIPEFRGLFVQYPGQTVRPPLSQRCQRWESVASGQMNGLGDLLGRLAG